MQGSSWSAHGAHRLAFAIKLFESLSNFLTAAYEEMGCHGHLERHTIAMNLVINALTTSSINRSIDILRQSKCPLLRVTVCLRRMLRRRCISYSGTIVCKQLTG
ncbi:hypothetical protein SCLCIDRAFT_594930 [Scleroderma citrinum Foug A]|uniref:Uncharacterized protein n=1 Tax=Scleroderma citrinum Foug A TaxID=1036808 RepID=A0A0C3E9X3_9AGAM|nr:hypothetical protein SCLCIDRAFT_594930 [Scleroderma citrinum Foug A]